MDFVKRTLIEIYFRESFMANSDWKTTDRTSVAGGSLVFDDAFFPALRNTDITLRKGALPVATGPFNFVAKDSGAVLPVIVTEVETAPFGKLSDGVFNRDGKGGRAQTLHDMQLFYPDLTEDSPVTAVSYKLAPA